ncbi:hypothetical protein QPK87_37310 [Kamptonema cortianum]|nr:hypothetical protein [Geitlerinema splendidum]MDK3162167.1 hypothetical protein [Kamptonema cortianum]
MVNHTDRVHHYRPSTLIAGLGGLLLGLMAVVLLRTFDRVPARNDGAWVRANPKSIRYYVIEGRGNKFSLADDVRCVPSKEIQPDEATRKLGYQLGLRAESPAILPSSRTEAQSFLQKHCGSDLKVVDSGILQMQTGVKLNPGDTKKRNVLATMIDLEGAFVAANASIYKLRQYSNVIAVNPMSAVVSTRNGEIDEILAISPGSVLLSSGGGTYYHGGYNGRTILLTLEM